MLGDPRRPVVAAAAAAALLMAGCADGGQDAAAPEPAPGDEQVEGEDLPDDLPEDAPDDGVAAGDPADDIEDGVYRGQGVRLPVPDGFTVDPASLAQGVVVAVSQDTGQQLTAQAIPAELLAGGGEDVDFDALLDQVRGQIPVEASVDEDVELAGAEQARRLTFEDLPGQQEGAPATSTTIVLAQAADGLLGEFTFSATPDTYDEQVAEQLLADAGFDPESEPAAPQPAPAPDGGGQGG